MRAGIPADTGHAHQKQGQNAAKRRFHVKYILKYFSQVCFPSVTLKTRGYMFGKRLGAIILRRPSPYT